MQKARRFGPPTAIALVAIAVVSALALGSFSKAEAAQAISRGQLVTDGKTIPIASFQLGRVEPRQPRWGYRRRSTGKASFSTLNLTPTGPATPVLSGSHFQTALVTSTWSKVGVTASLCTSWRTSWSSRSNTKAPATAQPIRSRSISPR